MDNKKISTNNFKIEKNVISFNDTLLQISNISQVSVEPISKYKFNFLSLIAGIIGFLMTKEKYNELIQAFGIIIISVVITYIIIIVLFNFYNDERYLHLYLNSGNVYIFYCTDLYFMKEVMKVIEYCINNHSVKKIRIDFDKCKVYNSPITIGNRNEVK